LAFLLAVVVLLAFVNLAHWRYYHLFREGKEQDLQLRLKTAAESLAAQVTRERPWVLDHIASQSDADVQAQIILEFATHPVVRRMDNLAAEQESLFRLAHASVLTTGGLLVAGDEWRFFELDTAPVARALGGKTAGTERYEIDGRIFQRFYAPIYSFSEGLEGPNEVMGSRPGLVVGLAAVALSPDFIVQLGQLQQQALRQSLVSSALLLVLAVSLWRLLSHAQRLESRALQGARAEAMGVLAAGLAHELRNPLGIIRMLGEEILTTESPGGQTAANIRDILGEVDRLGNLTQRFLSLARAPGQETGQAVAGHLITQAVELGPEIQAVALFFCKGAPTTLRLNVEPVPPVSVRADPESLRQVLLNLILNAQEALGDQPGQITLATVVRKDRIDILVKDNGPGIDARTLARVFDPFFTTKTHGSGLGLAISRAIAENAGGDLRLDSAPGHGTVATLSLPKAEGGKSITT
jgi:signal transduction histidine kinase